MPDQIRLTCRYCGAEWPDDGDVDVCCREACRSAFEASERLLRPIGIAVRFARPFDHVMDAQRYCNHVQSKLLDSLALSVLPSARAAPSTTAPDVSSTVVQGGVRSRQPTPRDKS